MFDVPIALFMFKRDKAVDIINRISFVKPRKLYLIGDGPRNNQERDQVNMTRKLVEDAIDWDCEIIKNYAETNRGVYENIAGGAKWVFEREEKAIFLEDDNLPEVSFFRFCEEMLDKYESEDKVLWVCGSNYLEKYQPQNESSYVFTKHMLPCGWASWSRKFIKNYDGMLEKYSTRNKPKLKKEFISRALYTEMSDNWQAEFIRISNEEKPNSWDYQMDFSLKNNGLFGICPTLNQIKNIGVDEHSIHGGTSFDNPMLERFCNNETFLISFPLMHPERIEIDSVFEKKVGKIMTPPFPTRIKTSVLKVVRSVFNIPFDTTTKDFFKNFFNE